MKTFLLVLFIPTLLFAQYGNKDYDLVKTTFQRSFDKNIISAYFSSGNEQKVNAALLSISHSEDTSFIPLITSINFNKFAEYICFALGQIGESKRSAKYIWQKIHSDSFGENSRYLFNALGKVGNVEDLKKLIAMYSNFDGPSFPFSGISIAVYQFATRGIKSKQSTQILIDEVNNPFTPMISKSDALFALARSGSSNEINDELVQILLDKSSAEAEELKMMQFALLNFKAQKIFPANKELFNNLLQEKNPLIKIETAKVLSFYEFKNLDEIKKYLKLLNNENLNIAITTAISIKDITSKEQFADSLQIVLAGYLNSSDMDGNVKGELFISYTKLFPKSDIKVFLKNIPLKYYYDYISKQNTSEENLDKLLTVYDDADNLSKEINLLTNLLNFIKPFPQNEKLKEVIINAVNSYEAPLVSIAADGIDSLFIENNRPRLSKIIECKTSAEKDNPDFIEGLMSLINLSENIDTSFYQKIISEVSSSELYSLRKFISKKNKGINVGTKDLNNFDELWEETFKYSSAIIYTNKGFFTIKFKPNLAPISVGNFCKLAEDNFFNGIIFHRVVPGFVNQGGDPTETGWGGPGYEIASEFSPLPYNIGMVGMASAGKDTEGSQWFVMQGNYPHLNGRYTIFAEVTDGMSVVYSIAQEDKIERIILKR